MSDYQFPESMWNSLESRLKDLHATRWKGINLVFSRKQSGEPFTSRHEIKLIGYVDLSTGEEYVSHCGASNKMTIYPYVRDEDNVFNMCECGKCHQRFFNVIKHGGSFTL